MIVLILKCLGNQEWIYVLLLQGDHKKWQVTSLDFTTTLTPIGYFDLNSRLDNYLLGGPSDHDIRSVPNSQFVIIVIDLNMHNNLVLLAPW